ELRQEPVADWGNDELSELRSIHERTGGTEQFEQFLEALEGFLAVDPAHFVVRATPDLPVDLSGVDRNRPVTQKTIAALTGKAQSTVSLAVRGLPGPSAADAALIRRVARELDYPIS
ncbi:helix-turn-helix domain-containing protein, partial [Nocardia nova]|nr:helix-turn-helix domain-containing protein [Nocardia nova]